jgi:hypothetical protein
MRLTSRIAPILKRLLPSRFYCEDCLLTTHNHDFEFTQDFLRAYERGTQAAGRDYDNRWRIHVAIWSARQALKADGDFLELGVNYGSTASAIMNALRWNTVNRTFTLIDSFGGLDLTQLSNGELVARLDLGNKANLESGFYNTNMERCVRNFSEWPYAKVWQGWVPQCLAEIPIGSLAFVHFDLNSALAETRAFTFLHSRMKPGCVCLLDDYTYAGGGETYREWNRLGLDILSLPTGQGLILL